MKSSKHPIEFLTVGEPASVSNLTIFPLLTSQPDGPIYIAAAEAMERHGMVVTEIDQSGSVPNLLVENPSGHCVLLLDGEELRGAKQNRIVNTTVLLAPRSKTKLPVSCVESGRWHYTSNDFAASKTIMSAKARRRKTRSVSHSLNTLKSYDSDQREVWENVDELNQKIGSQSNTGAMSAAYDKMAADLEQAVEKISCAGNQCGFIATVNGQPAGLDLVSRVEVYKELHRQLIQSYAMEALASRKLDPNDMPGQAGPTIAECPASDPLAAKTFLEQCAAIQGKAFPSVGLGTDWRFQEQLIVGSGLAVEDTWVHMAYFLDETDGPGGDSRRGRMARYSQRRRWRQE